MLSKIFNSRPFYIVISVLLALILYLNTTSSTALNQGNLTSGGQVYTTTLKNLPVTINYDQSKYFITGYVSSANIYLSSYNQIQLAQQESNDSRTFSLTSDLTGLGVGTHAVPIKVVSLPSSITAQVTPTTMSVTIEKAVSSNFTILPVIDPKLIPAGYSVTDTSLSTNSVTVTAGTTSIKDIAKIEAVLPSSVNLSQNYSGTVNLIAVDEEGNVVPALLSQQSVKLTIKVAQKETASHSSSSG